jgi:hypothetical protein
MDDSEFHPLADIFPMMDHDALNELIADIEEHGLREQITLFENKVLDGRNRYRALQRIIPVYGLGGRYDKGNFGEFRGNSDEALAYVVSKNLKRRHLDTSQRAMVAAKLATLRQGARTDLSPIGEMSQAGAAKLLNVGKRTVERAKEVLDHGDPDLIQAVERGEVAASTAAKNIRAEKVRPAYSDRQMALKPKPGLEEFAEKLAVKISNIFDSQLGEQIRAVVNEREHLSTKRCAALEIALIEVSICTHGWSEQLAGDAAGTAVELSTTAAWNADKMKWATERKELQREIKLHKRMAKAYLTSIRDTERVNCIRVDELNQDLNNLRNERDTLRYERDHPGDRAVAQAAAARAETVSTASN